MFYLFRPPTMEDRPYFLGSWGGDIGVTVLRKGDTFRNTIAPDQERLDAADAYWRGGYRHRVDEPTAILLLAAGYDVEAITSYGFGLGPFGEGPFGGYE